MKGKPAESVDDKLLAELERLLPPKPAEPWTRADAAAFLRVSLRTLERRIADRSVRTTKLGRRVLIPDAEVRRLANGRKR